MQVYIHVHTYCTYMHTYMFFARSVSAMSVGNPGLRSMRRHIYRQASEQSLTCNICKGSINTTCLTCYISKGSIKEATI